MTRFIWSKGGCVTVFVIILAIALCELLVGAVAEDSFIRDSVNAQCIVTGQDVVINEFALKLSCEGREARTTDGKVILSYMQNNGLLTCTVYRSGDTKCQPRASR